MTTKIRLLKKDVLIRPMDINEYTDSVIHIKKDDQHTDYLNYFEVLQISDEVTLMKAGDTVLLKHLQHTPPFELNGVMCAVTSEDEISAVIEN